MQENETFHKIENNTNNKKRKYTDIITIEKSDNDSDSILSNSEE